MVANTKKYYIYISAEVAKTSINYNPQSVSLWVKLMEAFATSGVYSV
jgi:hypothetical protein